MWQMSFACVACQFQSFPANVDVDVANESYFICMQSVNLSPFCKQNNKLFVMKMTTLFYVRRCIISLFSPFPGW